MKFKKLILILSIFIIAFTYIIHPVIEEKYLLRNPFIEEEGLNEAHNDDVIRFHVRANSDRKEDQDLKLKVRDEILKEMGEKFEDAASIDESRLIIKENIEEIKSIAENVIAQEKKDYPVDVSLGIEEFPVRTYGNLVFPQGNYEALIVEIGQAKGQNWWCVMFPPLCFVDVVHTYAYIDAENQLGEYIVDENQPLKLKSKIIDFLKEKGKK
ncbi:stage II sporulation protein R [Tissierella creatinini]|nr:stage II sporulation protein R [Tissierella creatinini]TJX60875.1 stage II sporulation protein R [Soehngenia saccharolytica]